MKRNILLRSEKDPKAPPLSYDEIKISLQNLVALALGYDGKITDLSYLEYKDYDDYVSESYYGKLLRDYSDYSIGEYYQLSSEEFIELPAEIMSVYLDLARQRKVHETAELEEAKDKLENGEHEKVQEDQEPRLHPAQQMLLDAQRKKET